ncbi:MAG TPA: M20 family metallopeptidase [Candidatus Pygmaiobacter gallistercoris]|nr:M20 family metallopeptidase [Candidatus Pygmaiobacter gallistercoris]
MRPIYDRLALGHLLAELVRIPSINPPGDEAPCADLLEEFLSQCPQLEISSQHIGENRRNLIAVLRGTGEKKALLFNGHTDVVPVGERSGWTHDPFGAEVVDGVMYGRGTGDMKAGLLALAAATRLLAERKERLKGDIVFLATAGEEVDGCGAKAFVRDWDMSQFSGTVIAEPTGSIVVSAERGALWVKIHSAGVTAHGSVPETGVNAIQYLIETLEKIRKGFAPKTVHPTLGKTTMNLGVFRGGLEPNIVPDSAYAVLDFRTVPGYAKEELLALINGAIAEVTAEHPDAKLSIELINDRPQVATDDGDPLIQTAVEVNRELGRSTEIAGKVACTDGSILNTVCDTPMLIYGPGEASQAHVYDEYVRMEDFYNSVDFFYGLAEKLLG